MTSYYTDLPFMAHPSCSYCMDLLFLVDSIYSSAVRGQLQFFGSMQLSSLTSSDAACDGFIKLQFENVYPSSGRNSADVSWVKYQVSIGAHFVYVFKLH